MYQRLLIVVDPSPASRLAINEGISLARALGGELLFFSVLPRYVEPVVDLPLIGSMSAAEFESDATKDAERGLAAAMAVADGAGIPSLRAVGVGVTPAQSICDAALEHHCGMIVVGSAGRNAVMRLLSGSVIPGLITLASVPVLVVRHESEHAIQAPVPRATRMPNVVPPTSH